MKNHLLVGAGDKTSRLLDLVADRFLLIDDGPIADAFLKSGRGRLFDIQRHRFNPLRGMDYKRARDFAEALYTASPQGENTLTVRNGRRALTRLLVGNPRRLDRLSDVSSDPSLAEAIATVDDMLLSPVLRAVLCEPPNFSFAGGVVAKLDRAQIGDFDAFLLASLLIGQTTGQVIVPDFGFYGRPFYSALVRQNRLIAGLQFLSELSVQLQQLVLSIEDKTVYRTTREDAERLIFYINPSGNPSILIDQADDAFKTT